MLNTSWQQMTASQRALVTIVYNAGLAFGSVTVQQWKDFQQTTTWRYPYYQAYVDLQAPYSAQADAWFAQLVTQPSDSYKSAIDTFITQCVTDANWLLLDRLWIFATQYRQHATVSLANPSSATLTEVAGPVWTMLQGYTGDGAASYLNLNLAPSAATQYTLNNASFGYYSRTNLNSGTAVDMGNNDGTAANTIFPRSGGVFNPRINCATSASVAQADSLGMFVAKRIISTTQTGWVRGVQTVSSANASNALSTKSFYVCANNASGVAGSFSPRQISMAFIGGGGIDQAKLYTAFQNFAITIGFNV